MSKEFLWVEKYRPKIVKDCILPDSTRRVFQGFVDQGELPNLLLSGTAGVGKTTIAKALCDEYHLKRMKLGKSHALVKALFRKQLKKLKKHMMINF